MSNEMEQKTAAVTINVKDVKEHELSEEDQQLKDELETLLQQLLVPDQVNYTPWLERMAQLIRASTTSMTSVPKPLKFMAPHYQTMRSLYARIKSQQNYQLCAEIISVLSMATTHAEDCLTYRLLCDSSSKVSDWGHEYVRHLSNEISGRYFQHYHVGRMRIIELVKQIVPHNLKHNAESDACDLLMEIDHLHLLHDFVDESTYARVCMYLLSCFFYVTDPEKTIILETIFQLSRKFKQHTQSLRFALMQNDTKKILKMYNEVEDVGIQKQMAFLLARQQICLELDESYPGVEVLTEIMSNMNLSKYFLNFARELDIMEPKLPEDIYKSHLEHTKTILQNKKIDSAKQNLAASFVNGFVNAGFCVDRMLGPDGTKWFFRNKEHGIISSTASLGLIHLWDIEGGLTKIDKFMYSNDVYVKSGALLGCGIINCGIRNEVDAAHALLAEYVNNSVDTIRIGAILGLGIAYVGTNSAIVIGTLKELLAHKNTEIKCITALSLGLICVSSCNPEVSDKLLQTLMSLPNNELENTFVRFLMLSLGLLYLGQQKVAHPVTVTLQKLPQPFKSFATTITEICAFAGTGNILKVQRMLHICVEHYQTSNDKGKVENKKNNQKEKEKAKKEKNIKKEEDLSAVQSIAVFGIALIAMNEDISADMALRLFGDLLHYCEPCVRRAVPLALGLIYASNPKIKILERLSKFSHDNDAEVAQNAIFGIGLVGAGTNNARIASMLRQLAQYHTKSSNNLFMVRIAQGLTHLGKGTLTLNPYHSDRQIMNPTAVAGIMTTIVAMLDAKTLILGNSHYLLYTLVTAIQPRMLITLDENLNQLQVPVRVGMAVDVVGQAGKPKSITGFQTQTTPVLLSMGDRAELATEEYISLAPVLEGFVILRKNPDYVS